MKFKSPDYYTRQYKSSSRQPAEYKSVRQAERVVVSNVSTPKPAPESFWAGVMKAVARFFT